MAKVSYELCHNCNAPVAQGDVISLSPTCYYCGTLGHTDVDCKPCQERKKALFTKVKKVKEKDWSKHNQKPVVEANTTTMWNYEYQAKRFDSSPLEILASDSLDNLKKEIRIRNWKGAWVTCKTGSLSYGQNVVDEYPYTPLHKNIIDRSRNADSTSISNG